LVIAASASEARRECACQSIGFALAAVIWIASALVPPPWRFWMWGAGLGVDLLTPFRVTAPASDRAPDAGHIEEPFVGWNALVFWYHS
jgi:low temperature requirement protein LtrA